MIVEYLFEHRMLVELIYVLIIVGSSLFVAYRIGGLYRLSGHAGLRYFRNAFLFFSAGYLMRFLIFAFGASYDKYLSLLFGYLMLMSAFYLLHSLLWKRYERPDVQIALMHPVALFLPLLSFNFHTDLFLFLPAIGLYTYGIIVARRQYVSHASGQLYLIAMVLFFLGWVVNFIGNLLGARFPWIILYVYGITVAIMLMFVLGVSRRRA